MEPTHVGCYIIISKPTPPPVWESRLQADRLKPELQTSINQNEDFTTSSNFGVAVCKDFGDLSLASMFGTDSRIGRDAVSASPEIGDGNMPSLPALDRIVHILRQRQRCDE